MKKNTSIIRIRGMLGTCGGQEVFLGFAQAKTLRELSFADILSEETGIGYQRPYNKQHSINFRKYILGPAASTIPLVFNLRKDFEESWKFIRTKTEQATLVLRSGCACLAQVDGQHRLGELDNADVPLAFMSFIGLDLRSEMAMFNVINGKAKGLTSSLIDFHESNLIEDLASEAPHLFISRKLNEDPASPWYQLIRYGGENTSGLKRRTSLRMMQLSIQRLISKIERKHKVTPELLYEILVDFWQAVRNIFSREWDDHRHHLLTKGLGLYALTYLLADLINDHNDGLPTEGYFLTYLGRLKGQVDWRSKGAFKEAGGQKGAVEIYEKIRKRVWDERTSG